MANINSKIINLAIFSPQWYMTTTTSSWPMWTMTTVTRRTPTCATCRSEHACTLLDVLFFSLTRHTHIGSSRPWVFHLHPHTIHDERFSLSCSTSPFTSTRTSSSFSLPPSPCTPTSTPMTLTPWPINNLRDSANGSLVTNDYRRMLRESFSSQTPSSSSRTRTQNSTGRTMASAKGFSWSSSTKSYWDGGITKIPKFYLRYARKTEAHRGSEYYYGIFRKITRTAKWSKLYERF